MIKIEDKRPKEYSIDKAEDPQYLGIVDWKFLIRASFSLSSFVFCLLLLPGAAVAAQDCGEITSDYVRAVLERADRGIAHARDQRGGDQDLDMGDLADQARSGMQPRIDTLLRLSHRARMLSDTTACLASDICHLEEKIREVDREIHAAMQNRSQLGVTMLLSVSSFLDERIYLLHEGGRDPTVRDRHWDQRMDFEPRRSDEEEIEGPLRLPNPPPESASDPMCPFHSNYLDLQITGYGCRQSSAETDLADAMRRNLEEADFLSTSQRLAELTRTTLPPIPGGSVFPEDTPEPLSGCSADENQFLQQIEGSRIGLTSRGSPFGFNWGDQVRRSRNFFAHRRQEGKRRNQLESYDPEDPDHDRLSIWRTRALVASGGDSYFGYAERQGGVESASLARAVDAPLQIRSILSPFTREVMRFGSLIRLASPETPRTIRSFVYHAAYYLRRSCILRPCNDQLDSIMRAAASEDCFPYASFAYLGDSRVHEKCLESWNGEN